MKAKNIILAVDLDDSYSLFKAKLVFCCLRTLVFDLFRLIFYNEHRESDRRDEQKTRLARFLSHLFYYMTNVHDIAIYR